MSRGAARRNRRHRARSPHAPRLRRVRSTTSTRRTPLARATVRSREDGRHDATVSSRLMLRGAAALSWHEREVGAERGCLCRSRPDVLPGRLGRATLGACGFRPWYRPVTAVRRGRARPIFTTTTTIHASWPSSPTLAILTRTGGAIARQLYRVNLLRIRNTIDPSFFRDLAWSSLSACRRRRRWRLARRQPLIPRLRSWAAFSRPPFPQHAGPTVFRHPHLRAVPRDRGRVPADVLRLSALEFSLARLSAGRVLGSPCRSDRSASC